MSDWMTSFNRAVGFEEDPADAQNKALNAQSSASDRALKLQQDQFDYQKSLQDPFFKGSLPSYYNLVDAITGERQTYNDPNAISLTQGEIAELNNLYRTQNGISNSFEASQQPGWNKYSADKTWYRDASGNITDQPAQMTSKAFNPTETDAYKWQQQQMEKNTGRTLRSLGRSNSSYGMNVMADQNRNLASSEYDKQLGRLADLTNIARGGASSLAQASTGYTNAAGQNIINMGNSMANASLAGGMLKQNSLYNNQQNGMSLANLGLKAYNAYQDYSNNQDNQGWAPEGDPQSHEEA